MSVTRQAPSRGPFALGCAERVVENSAKAKVPESITIGVRIILLSSVAVCTSSLILATHSLMSCLMPHSKIRRLGGRNRGVPVGVIFARVLGAGIFHPYAARAPVCNRRR